MIPKNLFKEFERELNMSFKIGIIGPLNIDLIMRGSAPTKIDELNSWSGPSEVHCLTAGAAGYVSQNLKKLGNDVHLVSCVGDDPFGVMILSSLKKIGINPSCILVEERKLGAIAIFVLLFGSKKRPLTFRLPTHHGWPPQIDKKPKKYLLDTHLLHSAGYLHFPDLWTNELPNLFKEAKEKGLKTSMDPQFPLSPLDPPWMRVLKPFIPYLDIIMTDENEALGITGEKSVEQAADRLYKEGIKIIAIKMGEKGAWVKNNTVSQQISAVLPKKFVDSIGAGDSFDAAFLHGLLEGKSIIEAGNMGAKAASMSIEGTGGTETFPTREQLKLLGF